MVKTVYAFIDVSSISASRFVVEVSPILEEILDDPEAHVIFSDLPGGNIYIARILKGHYYRNAIIYHTGETPRFNLSNLPTKGGFIDSNEVIGALIKDAEKVIRM